MKAAIAQKYGGPEVLKIEEVSTPEPKEGEVLVKVEAVAATVGDSRIRGSRFPKGFKIPGRLALGIFAPRNKILGSSFSGEIVKIGSAVNDFKVGDKVLGMNGASLGGYAEYIAAKPKNITFRPSTMTAIEAAGLTFGGTTAYYFLIEKAGLKKEDKVLINGASGAVGTNAVQIAKSIGAHVTAVCGTQNIDLVKSLGAESVIDYKNSDINLLEEKFDIVMDCVGNITKENGAKLLKNNGKLLLLVAPFSQMISSKNLGDGKRLIVGTASESKKNIEKLVDMHSEGKLKVIIDRTFPLEEIVEAHRLIDSGEKVGNIVLEIK